MNYTEEELRLIRDFEEALTGEFPRVRSEERAERIVFYDSEQQEETRLYPFRFVKQKETLLFVFRLPSSESDLCCLANTFQFDAIYALAKFLLSQGEHGQRSEQDEALWEELRACRLKTARELGVPAFHIFGNKTLDEIVREKPTSYEEWIRVKGLGDATYRKIGAEFLEIIKKYVDVKQERAEAAAEPLPSEEKKVNINGFDFVCDENGELLTDGDLLETLRELRYGIAREENLPAYCIVTNSALVGLATDKPLSREEWIKIKGLGERNYKKYGEKFIAAIKEYCKD